MKQLCFLTIINVKNTVFRFFSLCKPLVNDSAPKELPPRISPEELPVVYIRISFSVGCPPIEVTFGWGCNG